MTSAGGKNDGPSRLVVEAELTGSSLGQRLTEKYPHPRVCGTISPADYASHGAGDLILTRHQGGFIKKCPGTKGYICCGLQIIHLGLGCRLDCTYCILQGYLDTEALVIFGNFEDALVELKRELADPDSERRRFCTGEFTDSLLLESHTSYGRKLVELFSTAQGRVLELKTKTINIDGLLDADHGGRSIISFSVNAPAVSRTEESKATPLEARLRAASRAAAAGYRVGFHFDPLIRHQGWEDGYAQTVDRIYEAVEPGQIAWISLGAFRYLPGLKKIVRRRHRFSRIMDEEFVLAGDGKMRYIRPMRVEMYCRMVEYIRRADPEACIYMCMESPRVWREVFGRDPGPDGLIALLDERV